MPSPARAAAFAAAARTILAVTLAVLLAMAGGALAADAPAGKAEPEKAANAPAAGSGDDEDEDEDEDDEDENEDDEDDYEGMPPGDGRDEVFAYCSACHSMKLVTQQGLTRADWAEVLVYMVEEHEMAEIEPEDEKLVLDYLARFYGRDRRARKMGR
ncbi:MAG: hypothetical protein OXM58_13770 [Rhodospirillaceae bacterium]|nr:hypothetical protein [Rhodospirillaceae bacterium]MDE0619547.1 hypothetical protein [Rhodospirillaceae bacterium]